MDVVFVQFISPMHSINVVDTSGAPAFFIEY